MTDAIEKFDINAAAEKLKAQIRSAFIELLTPEQFRDMVAGELKRFTESRRVPGEYGRAAYDEPSAFTRLCQDVFKEHVTTELKAVLASPEYQAKWGTDGRQQISEAVQAWLTANSKQLIESTVLVFAGSAAQQMLDQLRHGLPR